MIDYDSNQHWSTKATSPPPSRASATTTTTTTPTTTTVQQDYPSDLLDSLRQHSLFQRANNEAFLTKLASGMHVRIYNPRDIIINKGESSKAMFFLLRGQVDVCSADFERVYATLSQGTCFGEIGILYAMPRTASVVAKTKCTVATLTSDQVHTLLPQFPEVDKIIRFEAEERLAVMKKIDTSRHPQAYYETTTKETTNDNNKKRNRMEKQQQQTSSSSTGTLGERQQRTSSVQYNVEAFSKTGIRTHLDKMPFFLGCSEDFLHLICLSIQPRNYGPNTLIFNQDDPGDEMYFIIDGFVDIEKHQSNAHGRLGPGGYFGDTSVLLNLRRPATMKTVTQVECYVLDRTHLQQVCDQFPDHRTRLKALTEARLNYITKGNFDELSGSRPMTFKDDDYDNDASQRQSLLVCRTTCDQDPTLPITSASQLRKIETRRRRPSMAVWNDPFLLQKVTTTTDDDAPPSPHTRMDDPSRKTPSMELPPSPSWATSPPPEEAPPLVSSATDRLTTLDTHLLAHLLNFLDFGTLLEMMLVNKSTYSLFASMDDHALFEHLDFSTLHKKITDDTFRFLMSFLHRHQLRSLSLSQCFHLTDQGFRFLFSHLNDDSPSTLFLHHLAWLDLNSCWHLTDQSLQLIGDHCPQLTHLDLSNCRKITNDGLYRLLHALHQHANTVKLQWISLSYCKNLTDVTMLHLANYTGHTLKYLNLQRCTKITDRGFQSWAAVATAAKTGLFTQLRHVVLVDCSFLTDRAIQLLVHAAPYLTCVVLSFCCSLSDEVMIHVARLAHLEVLDVSYCGAAVSDVSLRYLLDGPFLQSLNLRGCVRVTGHGLVAFLLDHGELAELNISQCPSIPSETKQTILDRTLVQHLII